MATAELMTVPRSVVTAQDFMPILDLVLAKQRHDLMVQIAQQLMVKDVDYGQIPGVEKPCLLKPGAEKLCSVFGLSPEFILEVGMEDWSGKEYGQPFFYYRYKCRLSRNDIVMGEGVGSCNSWESKYRWRWVNEDQVPAGMDKSALVSRGGRISEFEFAIQKAETGGKYGKPAAYWQAFRDAIERGAAKSIMKPMKNKPNGERAWEIDSTVYRLSNPEIFDQVNTVQKMAQKRCLCGSTPLLVKTSKGVCRMDVKSLAETFAVATAHIYVPGIDGAWRLVEAVSNEGIKPVQRISLRDGSVIRATDEHRFPTLRGLLPVADLKPGDTLLRSEINIGESDTAALPEIGWIVGLYLAKGHLDGENNGVGFTLNTDELSFAERIRGVATTIGCRTHVHQRPNTNTLDISVYGPAFRGLIMQFTQGKNSSGKHLSKSAWRQGKQFLSSVLDGYLAGDGSFTDREGRRPYYRLGFTGKNYELAEDLRALSAVLGKRVLLARSNARLKGVSFSTFSGWIKEPADTYNQKELAEITSIDPECKPMAVYDIQVDGDHLFCLGTGIQTHNSLIAGVLIATNASEFYTQDVEDMEIVYDVPYTVVSSVPASPTPAHSAPNPPADAKPPADEPPPAPEPPPTTAKVTVIGQHRIPHKEPEQTETEEQRFTKRKLALIAKLTTTADKFQKTVWTPFCTGWFGSGKMPKQIRPYFAPLEALERATEDTAELLALSQNPRKFAEDLVSKGTPSDLEAYMEAFMQVRGMNEISEVLDHLKAVGVDPGSDAEAIAYLRLACKTPSATLAPKIKGKSVAEVVSALEARLGKSLADAAQSEIEVALANVASGN